MLIQEHIKQIIELASPEDKEEYRRFYAEISPIKFGSVVSWHDAGDYGLARYQIPREAPMHIVARVETYTVNWTSGAPDFGAFEPPPPGFAFWQYQLPTGTVLQNLTWVFSPIQRLLDADEFMFFKGGYDLVLIGTFVVSPDDLTRDVRTLVYGYNIGPELANRLGRDEVTIPSIG